MRVIANTILRNKEGKYLLQMRDNKAPTFPLKWVFFGGGVDPGEEPLTAAIREMEEELGIKSLASDFERIVRVDDPKDDRVRHVAFYTPRIGWEDIVVFEGAGAGFFPREEIMEIPSSPGTKHVAQLLLK